MLFMCDLHYGDLLNVWGRLKSDGGRREQAELGIPVWVVNFSSSLDGCRYMYVVNVFASLIN